VHRFTVASQAWLKRTELDDILIPRVRAAFTILIFLILAVSSACMHESNPSVIRSSVRIEAAQRGDLQLPAGWLKDAIYIEKPALCSCSPDTDGNLFVLDAAGRIATQVKVHFGQSAGNFVEVQRGVRAGERVIVSDMSAYDLYQNIDLR
jgi:hypothetical protein